MNDVWPLSVAIPTYRREAVLLQTLDYLLAMTPGAGEIMVVDQSETHEPPTEARLRALSDEEQIRWVRRSGPSITGAMNDALRLAKHDIVLFLDDDVRPEPELFRAHIAAQSLPRGGLVAGRVIQPWQEGTEFAAGGPFHFASTRPADVNEFIGCNFSVRRDAALVLGGFDENFVRVAYRFEAEFAHRFTVST
jgi:glycosyltransferase involved in cell wall biosynthesis